MPMPVDARWLLISWRPSADDSLAQVVARWVQRLQDTLRVQCRDIEFRSTQLEPGERGAYVARLREDKCTDFLAIYTIDYCIACDAEAAAGAVENELIELARRIGQSPVRAWVARLDDSPPWEASGADLTPWSQRQRWRFLPAEGEGDFIDLTRPTVTASIYTDCVKHLKTP
jgi:hypothetical protein